MQETTNENCDLILSGLLENGADISYIASSSIKSLIARDLPESRLLSYCLDEAADQFLSEEFYQKYPELLTFLKNCGCSRDEVLFREFVETHRDIFKCKTYTCTGTIVGGCPKMYCDECGRNYFLQIDSLSGEMCNNCAANKMGECDEDSRRKRHIIYAS